MTTNTDIAAAEIVAWCPACKHYVGAEDIGEFCPSPGCRRKLVKRRGWICRECEPHSIFFSKKEYLAHIYEESEDD